MISNELKNILEKLQKQEKKMNFLSGATEEQVSEFEKKYKIKLPLKYKEWLHYSDGGELFLPAGIQLLGVAHKPLIDLNDDDRPNNDYIVIGTLAYGDPILCEKAGERISIYNHEAKRIEEDETYPDFFAFLGDLNGILGIGD